MTADPALIEARARIAAAHAAVAAGRYAEAIVGFRGAVPLLAAALGDDHPEVAEARDDLDAAEQMGGVADFLSTTFGRAPGDLPELPDPARRR